MKIIVKAKPGAKVEKVVRVDQPSLGLDNGKQEPVIYKVSVKEQAINGKANEAIIRALASYFDIAPSCVELVSGQSSKQKVFEVIM